MLTCICIDDDASSLEILKEYIDKMAGVKLLRSFSSPVIAVAELPLLEDVDIIFIDIEMPLITGIELAEIFGFKARHLVFTSAHQEFAIEAFRLKASGYLHKPYSLMKFAQIIQRILEESINTNNQISPADFLYLEEEHACESMVRVDLGNLIMISTEDQVLKAHTTEHSYSFKAIDFKKLSETLNQNPDFIQISKTTIISKKHIKKITSEIVEMTANYIARPADEHRKFFFKFVSQRMIRQKLKRMNMLPHAGSSIYTEL